MIARLLLASMAVLCSIPGQARDKEPYCSWDRGISTSFLDTVDADLLGANSQAAKDIIADALPFGAPHSMYPSESEELLIQPTYINRYDRDLRDPLWVAYRLKKEDVDHGVKREDSFRSDPRLEYWERSDCADYKEGIFDQGHMVPSADMKRSREAMASTYLMSNMTPQYCQFNRGPWQVLEELTRKWAIKYGEIWVISGTVFDRCGDNHRDADQIAWRMSGKRGMRVAIPSDQYKIIMRMDAGSYTAISFIIPNTSQNVPDNDMSNFIVSHISSLSEIRNRSGIYFENSDSIVESSEIWPYAGKFPKSLSHGCRDEYPQY